MDLMRLVLMVLLLVSTTSPINLNDKPKLGEIRRFAQKNGGSIDIIENIAEDSAFLTCILDDKNGNVLRGIKKSVGRGGDVMEEVFNKWLNGKTKLPVTWETLVECLEMARLMVLAGDIKEEMKFTSNSPEKKHSTSDPVKYVEPTNEPNVISDKQKPNILYATLLVVISIGFFMLFLVLFLVLFYFCYFCYRRAISPPDGRGRKYEASLKDRAGFAAHPKTIKLDDSYQKGQPHTLSRGESRSDHSPTEARQLTHEATPTRTLIKKYHHGTLYEQLVPCASKWDTIARYLDFHDHEISGLKANPTLLEGAPESYLGPLLSKYVQFSPPDSRGSKDVATLEALKLAVDRAGFAAHAKTITLEDSYQKGQPHTLSRGESRIDHSSTEARHRQPHTLSHGESRSDHSPTEARQLTHEGESREFTTLLNCTDKLEIALSSDREIMHFLNREGLIKGNTYKRTNDVMSLLIDQEKSGLLVSDLIDSVKQNDKNYHKFLAYLRSYKRKYRDIVKILDEEYERLGSVPGSEGEKDILETINDSPLGEPIVEDDLADVIEALSGLEARWWTIATNLHLRQGNMTTISTDYSKNAQMCLQIAMTDWLNLNYDYERHGKPSWRMLARAVRTLSGAVFNRIVENHGRKLRKRRARREE